MLFTQGGEFPVELDLRDKMRDEPAPLVLNFRDSELDDSDV